jgi:hypothetical protein
MPKNDASFAMLPLLKTFQAVHYTIITARRLKIGQSGVKSQFAILFTPLFCCCFVFASPPHPRQMKMFMVAGLAPKGGRSGR